ncbi:MAG TPA: hypothetical protein VGD42_18195 [Lysobacter sp.]
MKQFVIATLSLAGLLAPGIAASQDMQCVLVCNPPRVYCTPAGTPLPPIYTMCRTSSSQVGESSLSASTQQPASTESACTARQVFNEETQTYEWQMGCD